MTAGYHLFDTALGRCALAFDDRTIRAAALPGRDDAALAAAIRRWMPGSGPLRPPPHAAAAARRIAALFEGAADDMADVVLDLSIVSPFEASVYGLTRAIPPGLTRTYGALAADLGDPGAARAVGVALGRNPFAPIVPCHRVLAANGGAGGFSAPGGLDTKRRLLEIEGARRTGEGPTLFEHFGVSPGRGRV